MSVTASATAAVPPAVQAVRVTCATASTIIECKAATVTANNSPKLSDTQPHCGLTLARERHVLAGVVHTRPVTCMRVWRSVCGGLTPDNNTLHFDHQYCPTRLPGSHPPPPTPAVDPTHHAHHVWCCVRCPTHSATAPLCYCILVPCCAALCHAVLCCAVSCCAMLHTAAAPHLGGSCTPTPPPGT